MYLLLWLSHPQIDKIDRQRKGVKLSTGINDKPNKYSVKTKMYLTKFFILKIFLKTSYKMLYNVLLDRVKPSSKEIIDY